MTRTDLLNSIAEKTGFSKTDTEKVLKAATDAIMDGVAAGDKVAIHRFGIFEQVERKERHAHNPRTGEEILVAATKAPKFTAASAFKRLVKGTEAE